MKTIRGPYVYQNTAFVEDAEPILISDLLSTFSGIFVKIIKPDASIVYLDLRKVITFEQAANAYLSSSVVTFLNAWYVPSTNQMGLELRYGDSDVGDMAEVGTLPFIRAINPIADETLTVLPISINSQSQTPDQYREETMSDVVLYGERDLSNMLCIVNGVFHNTIFWNKAQYIIDGMYSFRQNQKFDMVCYDTSPVGGHTVVPITRDMCTWDADGRGIILTLPAGMSFSGKSAFTAIDGYLFHPDEILEVMSPTMAVIHTARIPFVEQWRHNPLTKRKKDIAGLNWVWAEPAAPTMSAPPVVTGGYRSINQQPDLELFVNTRTVPYDKVTSQDFRFNRVTSPHSAIILVNKPSLTHSVIRPYSIQVPNQYGLTKQEFPCGISRYGCGLSPSYTILKSGTQQTWVHVEPQDYDIDRQRNVLNPACVTTLYPQVEDSLSLPFSMHVFS